MNRCKATTHSSLSLTSNRVTTNNWQTAQLITGVCAHDNALNTFYLRIYGIGHMVKDHSDSERRNPLPPHRLLFSFSSKGSFICIRQDNTYHRLCYTSRGALAGMRNSSMGPPHEGLIRRPIAPWVNALTTELHLAPVVDGVQDLPQWVKSPHQIETPVICIRDNIIICCTKSYISTFDLLYFVIIINKMIFYQNITNFDSKIVSWHRVKWWSHDSFVLSFFTSISWKFLKIPLHSWVMIHNNWGCPETKYPFIINDCWEFRRTVYPYIKQDRNLPRIFFHSYELGTYPNRLSCN